MGSDGLEMGGDGEKEKQYIELDPNKLDPKEYEVYKKSTIL